MLQLLVLVLLLQTDNLERAHLSHLKHCAALVGADQDFGSLQQRG